MKQKASKPQVDLERRDLKILELAKNNPEYAYIADKKHPDPGLRYEIWNKQIIDKNGI